MWLHDYGDYVSDHSIPRRAAFVQPWWADPAAAAAAILGGALVLVALVRLLRRN